MATRRRGKSGKRISRIRSRGRPVKRIIATHYHPDHLGNARWLMQRFGCPVAMTQAEFLTAHAVLEQRATHSFADICAMFVAHGLATELAEALVARGNLYRRGVPDVPERFQRMLHGDDVTAGGAIMANHLRLWAFSGARFAAFGHPRTADFRRHAAAAHQHQRKHRSVGA